MPICFGFGGTGAWGETGGAATAPSPGPVAPLAAPAAAEALPVGALLTAHPPSGPFVKNDFELVPEPALGLPPAGGTDIFLEPIGGFASGVVSGGPIDDGGGGGSGGGGGAAVPGGVVITKLASPLPGLEFGVRARLDFGSGTRSLSFSLSLPLSLALPAGLGSRDTSIGEAKGNFGDGPPVLLVLLALVLLALMGAAGSVADLMGARTLKDDPWLELELKDEEEGGGLVDRCLDLAITIKGLSGSD